MDDGQLPADRPLVTRMVALMVRPPAPSVILHMEEELQKADRGRFDPPVCLGVTPRSYFRTYFWTRQFSVSATKISSRGEIAM